MKFQAIWIILLELLVPQIEMKKMYNIVINSFEPMSDTKANFINFGNLRFSKKGRNSLVFTGNYWLFKNIGNEYKVKLDAFRKDLGVTRLFMSKVTNFCELLKNDKTVYPDLMKVSNMPDQNICPFVKGNYTINNYVLDENKLPDVIPIGEWTLKIYFELDNQIQGGYVIIVTVNPSM